MVAGIKIVGFHKETPKVSDLRKEDLKKQGITCNRQSNRMKIKSLQTGSIVNNGLGTALALQKYLTPQHFVIVQTSHVCRKIQHYYCSVGFCLPTDVGKKAVGV